MSSIELIFDADCPNVPDARQLLRQACAFARCAPEWIEWERSATDAPPYVSTFGSPTILVDGHDVVDEPNIISGSCCRLYGTADGRYRGVPPLERLIEALLRALSPAAA